MSSDKELMQRALEALEAAIDVPCYGGHPKQETAAAALRERLAQPEQKPYAWMAVGGTIWRHKATEDDTPIYTHPPQRKPLTEQEMFKIWLTVPAETEDRFAFARAIEAAHGIKGEA